MLPINVSYSSFPMVWWLSKFHIFFPSKKRFKMFLSKINNKVSWPWLKQNIRLNFYLPTNSTPISDRKRSGIRSSPKVLGLGTGWKTTQSNFYVSENFSHWFYTQLKKIMKTPGCERPTQTWVKSRLGRKINHRLSNMISEYPGGLQCSLGYQMRSKTFKEFVFELYMAK